MLGNITLILGCERVNDVTFSVFLSEEIKTLKKIRLLRFLMDFKYSKKKIEIKNKAINKLDKFVLDFISFLNKHKIKYVIVSGYVSILFGRNRTSEDVDIIVEKLDFKQFSKLWVDIYEKLECLNTSKVKDAYEEYLSKNVSLRFSKKDSFIPNIEFKFPKLEIDSWTLNERIKVLLNDH